MFLTKPHKIPVFYHIPKNAGTYVSDWMLIVFRYYHDVYTKWWLTQYKNDYSAIKIIQITNSNKILAKFLMGDPNYTLDLNKYNFIKKFNKVIWDIDIKFLSSIFLKELFLFGIIIESHGFKIRKNILNLFNTYNLYEFLILRNPFHRIQSIYNYNTSNESLNDYSHGLIKSKTFEEYIMSNQLEDSWLIRNLINLNDSESLEEHHFQQSLEILKSFNVYDIKDVDKAVQQTFQECYNFNTQTIKLNPWDKVNKNQTSRKKITFEELSLEAQKTFIERIYWDNRLYEQFIK